MRRTPSRRLAQEPALVALRPMVQDIADDDWLMRPDLVPAFEALIAHDLVFDALVLPRHLTRLAAILDNHPNLEVVVDHGAKPAIRDRCFEPWASDIARIAQAPQAACKLSGLVTEASANWSADDLRAYVDHLLAVFGPRRLIWGSDWPVVNLAGGYERWLEASEALLSGLSADERAAVLGGNATLVYNALQPTRSLDGRAISRRALNRHYLNSASGLRCRRSNESYQVSLVQSLLLQQALSGSLKDLSAFPKDAKCPLQRAVDDRSNLGVDSIAVASP